MGPLRQTDRHTQAHTHTDTHTHNDTHTDTHTHTHARKREHTRRQTWCTDQVRRIMHSDISGLWAHSKWCGKLIHVFMYTSSSYLMMWLIFKFTSWKLCKTLFPILSIAMTVPCRPFGTDLERVLLLRVEKLAQRTCDREECKYQGETARGPPLLLAAWDPVPPSDWEGTTGLSVFWLLIHLP